MARGEGFTPLPNKVYDALIASDLSSLQLRAVLFVWRTTFGWRVRGQRLESRRISLCEWAEKLGVHKATISRSLASLEAQGVIFRQYQGLGRGFSGYRLNTEVETWRGVAKSTTVGVAKNTSNCCENDNKLLHPQIELRSVIKEKYKERHKEEFTPPPVTDFIDKPVTPPPLSIDYSFKGSEGLRPPETPLSSKEESSVTAKVTHTQEIVNYLEAHGPASIKSIALATGIDPNNVNVRLHKREGKLFVHFPDRRMWGVNNASK